MLNITDIVNKAFSAPELTTNVEINGIKFKLGASSNKDAFAVADLLEKSRYNKEDALAVMAEVRIKTIAAALISINGEVIPQVVEKDGEKLDKMMYLYGELTQWPTTLITNLFNIISDFKDRERTTVMKSVKYEWFGDDVIKKELEEEAAEKVKAAKAEKAEKDIELTQVDIPSDA
jgi:hypothetical protein